MHIRSNTSPFGPILGACDDDGCGVTGGPSAVTFSPPGNGYVRVYIYTNGACGNAVQAPGLTGITVTCLGPSTPPANDDPCGAPDLGPLTGSCSNLVAGTTVGATFTTTGSLGTGNLDPTTGCSLGDFGNNDVWYRLQVPASGMVGVDTEETSACALGLGIYRASDCTDDPFQWVTGTATGLCAQDGLYGPEESPGIVFDAFQYGMAVGDVVYIRVWERNNNENGEFTICAFEAERPVNDEACGAIVLPVLDDCAPVEYSTNNSSPFAAAGITLSPTTPGCANPGIPLNDVWFQVTVPPTGAMTVNTFAGDLDDMGMAWYRLTGNACSPGPGTLVCINPSCSDNQSATNLMPRTNSVALGIALVPGETIYIRVWNSEPAQSNYYGTFSICVTPNNPPPNDQPCGALPLTVDYVCNQVVATNENATQTGTSFPPAGSTVPNPTCGGTPNSDVWFTVQVPLDLPLGEDLILESESYVGATNMAMAAYRSTGSCTSDLDLTQLGCATTGGTPNSMPRLVLTVPAITPGELLYVRMWTESSAVLQGEFGLCALRNDPQICGGTIFDSGGPGANYQNNEVWEETFCPWKPGDVVTLDFSQFNIENGWDFFSIYDGPTTGAPLIGTFTGTGSPGVVSATINPSNPGGCLTVRFTSDFIITAPGYAFTLSCAPPEPPPPPPVGDCGLVIHDPGGPFANYANNIGQFGNPPYQQTFCPNNAGDVVSIDFSSFNIEANWDKLYIFNGTTATFANIINSGNGSGFGPQPFPSGAFWGGDSPGVITSTHPSGCLTLYFVSDASITQAGWTATVNCGPPPPPPPPPVGDCGVQFFDPGGPNANYGNNINGPAVTYCAPAGQVLTVTFSSFNLEPNWDKLYVFQGNSTAAPQISSGNGPGFGPAPFGAGGFWGTAIPGPFSTTVGGCLTFFFSSDGSVTRSGWRALTSCAVPPTNDNPCTPGGAILLPVSTACVQQTFSNEVATPTPGVPAPGCANYQGGDVWFRFVAPANGRVMIESFAGTLTSAGMALYSAPTCSGPYTLLACDDDGGQNGMPRIDRLCNTLNPGQTYYLRVWGQNGQQGEFDLCIRTRDDAAGLSDCLGSFSICDPTPFPGLSLGAGCFNDLNPVNRGCLSAGERQGSWYAFTTESPGQLGMTITPSANVDIDWAIWGPYAAPVDVSTLCTPTGPPIRCSSASLYYTELANGGSTITGMGNANPALNTPQFAPAAPALFDGALPTIDGWTPGIQILGQELYLLFVDDHYLTGDPYSVSWSVTPDVPGTNVIGCSLLPVELLDLEAVAHPEHVDVLWTTATERNSSHFMVQRSADGHHFVDLGRVSAAGESFTPIDYLFKDEEPLEGVSYYRLRAVDQDGTWEYTDVVSVMYRRGGNDLELYPNPAMDWVRVRHDMATEGLVRWRILDASGRRAMHGDAGGTKGRNEFEIVLGRLEAGTYLLELYDEEGARLGQARFVKQR